MIADSEGNMNRFLASNTYSMLIIKYIIKTLKTTNCFIAFIGVLNR